MYVCGVFVVRMLISGQGMLIWGVERGGRSGKWGDDWQRVRVAFGGDGSRGRQGHREQGGASSGWWRLEVDLGLMGWFMPAGRPKGPRCGR